MKKIALLLLSFTLFSCSSNQYTSLSSLFFEKESLTHGEGELRLYESRLFEVYKEQVFKQKLMSKFCRSLKSKYYKYGWGKPICSQEEWIISENITEKKRPLIYKVYGAKFSDDELKEEKIDTTLIMCGVHGDEITPVKFCNDVIRYLNKGSVDFKKWKNKRVVVAPLVSPDSFFKRRPTRTNANGIDVNRNFPTRDWHKSALQMWRKKYRKSKRRYPGSLPASEPETKFQMDLMSKYKPGKIISVHAPLTMLDYDGPKLTSNSNEQGYSASVLLFRMSKYAKGYRVKDYPFFPGSLGNYAGNEQGIPTYTLELPSIDNRKHRVYWNKFKKAIHSAILHVVPPSNSIVRREHSHNHQ